MSVVLDVDGIDKRFGGLHAVRALSLAVGTGELVGLFGPNGAGKTTLFNMIAGSLKPDAGAIRLNDADITKLPAWRRARAGVGRTLQKNPPFRDFNAPGNVL